MIINYLHAETAYYFYILCVLSFLCGGIRLEEMDDRMYVIKNNETGKWIGVDNASGGYPYDTDIQRAEIFYTKERALKYKNVMKANWSLYRLEMHGIPERWENEA